MAGDSSARGGRERRWRISPLMAGLVLLPLATSLGGKEEEEALPSMGLVESPTSWDALHQASPDSDAALLGKLRRKLDLLSQKDSGGRTGLVMDPGAVQMSPLEMLRSGIAYQPQSPPQMPVYRPTPGEVGLPPALVPVEIDPKDEVFTAVVEEGASSAGQLESFPLRM